MVAARLLLLFSLVNPPGLQRRTTPPLHEESCKEHLLRIRAGLVDISLKHADLKVDPPYYRERAATILASDGLRPSFETCGIRNLKELDVVLALWEFEYLTDLMNQELPAKEAEPKGKQ